MALTDTISYDITFYFIKHSFDFIWFCGEETDYHNTPMQYTAYFNGCKMTMFSQKQNYDIFSSPELKAHS